MRTVYFGVKAIVLLTLAIGASLPASAADLDIPRYRHHHYYRHDYVLQRSYRWFRDDRYLGTRDFDACPVQEPADYRPRLVGEPLCQAARPYGLSGYLY